MKRSFVLSVCTVLAFLLPIPTMAIGPQLQVDCGNWNYLKDSNGSYRELSAVAIFDYSGSNFSYRVKFYGSKKENFSRGTFQGTYAIKNPESSFHSTEFPLNMKFRNNKYESFMYKTKYIKAEIKFTDSEGFEAYKTCIWKWN